MITQSNMYRCLFIRSARSFTRPLFIHKNTFLTNEYKCSESWNSQISSPILTKVNLHDFYNTLDLSYSSKGVISAIDVDIFANAIKEPIYLEELKDLLHKLRLSADTGITLDSTHHATIRNFIEFDHIPELVEILKDPLNYGIFLDDFTANILLDKLVTAENYELAANVASIVMLQEDYSNKITCALGQYACYKYILNHKPKEEPPMEEKNKKVEEIKIRIKFLRNPYFDDHFDIKDLLISSGKTLAWISEKSNDNLSNNLQIIGWLNYKKYEKLFKSCEQFSKQESAKVYSETIKLLEQENTKVEEGHKPIIESCIALLSKLNISQVPIEESLKISIENAINANHTKDISQQKECFQLWEKTRKEKLDAQIKRLDRAKRTELIEERQKKLQETEQKLWFFDNEEQIDLEIEKKESLVEKTNGKKTIQSSNDDDYIPPEILPKRR